MSRIDRLTGQSVLVCSLTVLLGLAPAFAQSVDFALQDSPSWPPRDAERPVVTSLPRSAVMLDGVPTSTWTYGCTATAAGMAFGYYDRHGYPDMYTGPTNGGVAPLTDLGQGDDPLAPIPGACSIIATMAGFDGHVTAGHVDDYWIGYLSAGPDPWESGGVEHTWADCTADFLGTNQWKWARDVGGPNEWFWNTDGSTVYWYYTDGSPNHDPIPSASYGLPQTACCHGMRLFAESRGYAVATNYNQLVDSVGADYGFTFAQYMAEIDGGHPVLIHVTGHSMVGVGYEAGTQTVYLHDTWDNQVHSMTWGGSYAGLEMRGVTVLHLSDCNGNGVDDWFEVANGTSPDCDFNGVPDECDIADCDSDDPSCQDCNGNGVPDGCDIADGTSVDADGDGIPDECAPPVLFVDDDAPNDPGPGDPTDSDPLEDGSAAHPYDAIQEAMDAARLGDEVVIANGTYTGSGNKNLDFGGKAITVRSASGNPTLCIIDCQHSGRGFYFHSGEGPDSVVAGLTIMNGSVDSSSHGGALYCNYAHPTFRNCVITENTAPYGGGLACWHSNPILVNCVISANTATIHHGGGVYCDHHSDVTLTNCVISGNSAPRGGGVLCDIGADPLLTNCVISGNTASDGGGVYCDGGNPTLTNCILWGNTPQEVYIYSGTPTITYSNVQGSWPGVGNIDVDPQFWDPDGLDDDPGTWADNDYRLAPGSPCIDAGDSSALPADALDLDGDGDTIELLPIDADGTARRVDDPNTPDTGTGPWPLVDMGAYEGPETDCDGDGISDDRAVSQCDGSAWCSDCNANGLPDECDIADCDPADPACQDCNGNGVPDGCDIAGGTSADVNSNDIPDECEPDCNFNGIPDEWEVSQGLSPDCNGNGRPDECDISDCDPADPACQDCNGNGVMDACDLDNGTSEDCNSNGVPDGCDLLGWSEVDLTAPTGRYGHAMVYDSNRNVAVLFGGSDGMYRGDTWEHDGSAWTRVATGGPTPRRFHAMAYDSVRGVTVLFGGVGHASQLSGETWEWDGSTWTLVADSGPSPRMYHAMTYDSARGVTVLFGGRDSDRYGDTWEWDGTTWTRVATDGPSPRSAHAMNYDAARGVTVLFGGSDGEYRNDTWEWNGSAWAEVASNGASPRYGHALAYDSTRGVTVLFGGRDGSTNHGDTWEWDGQTWTERAVTGPSARYFHAMAFGAARGAAVLFGGASARESDLWEWDGTEWTLRVAAGPDGRSCHALAYDSARGVTVLYGGGVGGSDDSDETWEWDGDAWTLVATSGPGPRAYHALAYDSARGVTVLFGGRTGDPDNPAYGDTWEWNGSTWTQVAITGPGPCMSAAMAYDSAREVTVLYGGNYAGANETWEWDANVWTRVATTGPGYRHFGHVMAYDSARGVTVLYGGNSTEPASAETWEWDGDTWTLATTDGPGRRKDAAVAYDSERAVTVLFGGAGESAQRQGDTWQWDGSTWTQVALVGPRPRDGHAMVYDPARHNTVLFGGFDGGALRGDTWVFAGHDCNANEIPDDCDVAGCDPYDPSCQDCNGNGVPDACDIAACNPNDPACQDCDGNGVPDECDVANCDPVNPDCQDCNANGVPDACDIASGASADCDLDGVPDGCAGYQRDISEAQRLFPPDTEPGDMYGYHASDLAGDVAIVGAPYQNTGADEAGAAYIYRFDGTRWQQESKLTSPNPQYGDQFGCDVAVDGEVAVVGAAGDNGATSDEGSAYVYLHSGGTWTLQTTLKPGNPQQHGDFGATVAIEGGVIVVGATRHAPTAPDAGAAFVFVEPGGGWPAGVMTATATLLAADGLAGDLFGECVAVSGATIAVSTSLHDPNGVDDAGAVYLYEQPDGGWSGTRYETAKIVAEDGAVGDRFGKRMALHDDLLVSAARYHGPGGAAYVYRRTAAGDDWRLEAQLVASDVEAADQFGFSIATDGASLLIGSLYANGHDLNSGAAYLYVYTPDHVMPWQEEAKLSATDGSADDWFGAGIAIDGDNALVTARPWGTGSAYFFRDIADCNGNGVGDGCDVLSGTSLDCNLNGIPDECDTFATGDFDGDGLVDVDDFVWFTYVMAGPDIPVGTQTPECDATFEDAFEMDDDQDVDVSDFSVLQRLFMQQ